LVKRGIHFWQNYFAGGIEGLDFLYLNQHIIQKSSLEEPSS